MRSRRFCFVIGWLLLVHAHVAVGVAGAADECERCTEIARKALECPNLPRLRIASCSPVWAEGDGPPHLTRCLLEAVNGALSGELWVNHDDHESITLTVGRSLAGCGVQTVTWDQVRENAGKALNFLTSEHAGPETPAMQLRRVEAVTRKGCISLRFQASTHVADVVVWLPPRVTVGVAVDTGQVLALDAHALSMTTDPLAIAPTEQVLDQCFAAAATALGMPASDLRSHDVSHDCILSRRLDPPRTAWRVAIMPAEAYETGVLPLRWAQVTFRAHEVLEVSTTERPPWLEGRVIRSLLDRRPWEERGAELLRPTQKVDDRWPVWGEGGESLFLLSKRPRPGAPWWRRVPSVAKVSLGNGLLECVHAPLEGTLRVLSLADGLVAANNFNRHEVQLLRLRDGRCMARGYFPDKHFDEPSLAPDATAIVYSAARRHGDTDIFVDEIEPDFDGLTGHRRLCKLDGTDRHPVFIGDGERVCFVHVEWGTHAEGGDPAPPSPSLYVVNAGASYWENDPPVQVVEGFTKVHRLSTFLDGQRVLVADEAGLWIVDVESWTKTALALPELHDPDLADGPALKIREPAVSPDGTRLAFSGYRDSGDPEKGAGWYIYVCDLDGANLRRVTPLEDEPVPAYVFPETGKTAFDVAREIAQARMR